MKLLASVLVLISVQCLASFDLEIEVFDVTDQQKLQEVTAILGNKSGKENYFYQLRIEDLDTVDLTRTLFIHYPGYMFEEKAPVEYNYEIKTINGRPTILIRAYGIPCVSQHILNLPIAKKSKTTTDSIWLKAYLEPGYVPTSVALRTKEHKEIFKVNGSQISGNLLTQSVALSNVEEGYFELEFNDKIIQHPFRTEDWFQPIFLSFQQPGRIQETKVLKLLIQNQERYENKMEQMNYQFMIDLQQKQQTIDSLEWEIYLLKNGPQEEVMVELEEPPIEEEVMPFPIIEFVKREARPVGGMQKFLLELKDKLGSEQVKYTGGMLLQLKITKRGNVNVKPLWSRDQDRHIFIAAIEYTSRTKWEPARNRGKIVDDKVLVYLNFFKP